MTWNFGGPSLASITNLLKGSDPYTLEDVLEDAVFQQAVRNSLNPLMNYLTKDETLDALVDWALTNKNKDHEKCAKLTRSAVAALTSSSSTLNAKLTESKLFIDRLISFMASDDRHDARISGHFQRIVEQLVRATQGEFLSSLPDLSLFLIENLGVLGLRELFMALVPDFTSLFNVTNEMMVGVSKKAVGDDAYFVITAIRGLIKVKAQLLTYFDSVEVVENLLECGVKHESALVRAVALSTAELIIGKSSNADQYKEIVVKYGDEFIAKHTEIDCGVVAGLRLFKKGTPAVLEHILDIPAATLLNEGILAVFQNMSEEERDEVAKQLNLYTRIMEVLPKSVANGQLTDLADILKSNVDGWKEFQEGFVQQRKETRTSYYGGKMREQSSESEEDIAAKCEMVRRDDSDSDSSYSEDDDSDEEVEEPKAMPVVQPEIVMRSLYGIAEPVEVVVERPVAPACVPPPPESDSDDEEIDASLLADLKEAETKDKKKGKKSSGVGDEEKEEKPAEQVEEKSVAPVETAEEKKEEEESNEKSGSDEEAEAESSSSSSSSSAQASSDNEERESGPDDNEERSSSEARSSSSSSSSSSESAQESSDNEERESGSDEEKSESSDRESSSNRSDEEGSGSEKDADD